MKLGFTTDSTGVHINCVSASNSCIYDNDMILDTPELFFLWLKANKGQVNLVGNVNTRDLFIPPNIVHSHDSTFNQWTDTYNKAMAIGLKNIPKPVKGSEVYLTRPASGVPEQTVRKDSVGSDLIISEARKCTAAKPLVIFVGGQVTSIANAYLKDNSIADKVVVLHVDGWDKTDYNGVDYWANEIVMRKMLYCNWDGSFINNQTTWYDPFRPLQVNFNGMPANPWTNLLRDNYYNQAYARWKDVGDAPPVFWFFDNSVWKNVVKRTAGKQTVTGDTYDYILVSDNDWPKYGAMLSAYMVNPQNYIPGTTPVNNAPTISILTPSTTYSAGSSIIITATASDDKAVSKVEFFNGSIKLGESLTSPYSWVINNATAGTYNLTGKATDNEGASTVSAVRVVTVSGVVIPPVDPPQTGKSNLVNVMDFGAVGDGKHIDSDAFQKAAIAAKGKKLYIPTPPVQYVIDRTIEIRDPSGQVWMDLEANAWPLSGTNHIEYRGPSGSSVFYIVGLKGSVWQGLKVRIKEGLTGVTIFDFDTTPKAQSSSFNSIRNCYFNLGDKPNNIGVRMGVFKEGLNHGDISNFHFENHITYGKQNDIQPGSTAFMILGENTLSHTWIGGFTAFCDYNYSNKAPSGARGDASVSFFGFGCSQNHYDFSLAYQQCYNIHGGRFEGTKKSFLQVIDGAYASISVVGAQIDEVGDGFQFSPFVLNTSCSLNIQDSIVNHKNSNTQPTIKINYGGPNKGTVSIRNGAVRSNALYTGKNTNWRVYVEGVNRNKPDVWATEIWPDERP